MAVDPYISEHSPAPATRETESSFRDLIGRRQTDPGHWEKMMGEYSDASVDQLPSLAAARWGQDKVSCLTINDGNETIGGATVVSFKLPIIGRGVSLIKHGPTWRQSQHTRSNFFRPVVEQVISEYSHDRGNAIIIVPRPSPDTLADEMDCLLKLGFVAAQETVDPNRYIVDASLDEESQMRSLGQKWRYNLRKGLKHEHKIIVSTDGAQHSAFSKLHSEMVSRKSFVDNDPIDALPHLSSKSKNIRPIYFTVQSEDKAIASAVVMVCGDMAFYVFGASAKEALRQNAGYVLQWSILDYLRQLKVRWYDLGGEAGSTGLQQFKTGLTGKSGVVLKTPGELKYSADARAEFAYRTIQAARSGVRGVRALLKK